MEQTAPAQGNPGVAFGISSSIQHSASTRSLRAFSAEQRPSSANSSVDTITPGRLLRRKALYGLNGSNASESSTDVAKIAAMVADSYPGPPSDISFDPMIQDNYRQDLITAVTPDYDVDQLAQASRSRAVMEAVAPVTATVNTTANVTPRRRDKPPPLNLKNPTPHKDHHVRPSLKQEPTKQPLNQPIKKNDINNSNEEARFLAPSPQPDPNPTMVRTPEETTMKHHDQAPWLIRRTINSLRLVQARHRNHHAHSDTMWFGGPCVRLGPEEISDDGVRFPPYTELAPPRFFLDRALEAMRSLRSRRQAAAEIVAECDAKIRELRLVAMDVMTRGERGVDEELLEL